MVAPLNLSRRALIAAAAALASGCDAPPPKANFKGVDISGADYARQLSLTDVDGRTRSLAEFQGKAVVVFFGFTQCPDVCPTTMAELADVRKRLGPDGDRVQPVFVTVDPARDTPEVLKAYVRNFGPDVVALRGTPDETKAAARSFKVFYAKVPGKDEGRYSIDHTAGSYVFDPKGRVRLFVRYGVPADDLAHDLKLLLQGA